MKKHLSVLALYARNNFLLIFPLPFMAGLLEAALFVLRWRGRDTEELVPPTVEQLLRGIPLICALFFLLLLFLLYHSGDDAQNVGYTIQCLRISEQAAVCWKAVYNSICLLFFWAVQAASAVWLCRWYAAVIGPDYRSSQTVFLAFYRSSFLHGLLPLDNWTRYLSTVCLLAALGFSTAALSCKRRRGSRFGWGMTIFLYGSLGGLFQMEITAWTVDAFAAAAALAAIWVEYGYLTKMRGGERSET